MSAERFDLVLFGATGFTGTLTAEYLAQYAPNTLRWAIAGRSLEKLRETRDWLRRIDPRLDDLELIVADVDDRQSLDALASSTEVVISTVGPYAKYGEPLVAACVLAGTDYADLCGEPEFLDRVWLNYHDAAKASGARLVHSCGFDSLPHDLGAYFTVLQLPEEARKRVEGIVRMRARFSGGTHYSTLLGFSRARQTVTAALTRRRREPKPVGRKVGQALPTIRFKRSLGGWVVPFPTIDPQIVLHAAAADARYGPRFKYGHFIVVKHFATILAVAFAGVLGFIAAQIPPLRKLMLRRVKPGEGPSEEERAKSWFSVRFIGTAGGQRVETEVSGGDPAYTETSKMLAESGVALAQTRGQGGGQMSPSTAIGDELLRRLPEVGITFEVVSTTSSGQNRARSEVGAA